MSEIVNIRPLIDKLRISLISSGKNLAKKALAAVTVGCDHATCVYISSQQKLARELNVEYQLHELPENISQSRLEAKIHSLNLDPGVKGIIIHKPLPAEIDQFSLFSLISPDKDIEGVTPFNLGRIVLKQPQFIPPTVLSVLAIIDHSRIELYGRDIVLVGFSAHIGKPLSLILADRMATVNITHIATWEKGRLPDYIKQADVVISCVGKPGVISGDWIKPGAAVIDVGISRCNGKVTGDVEFEKAAEKASLITPVPGGVGPLTTWFLFKNFIEAEDHAE